MSDTFVPSPEAYLALLDPDPDVAAQKYDQLRAKLTRFFEWRGCQWPDDLAAEVIARAFARIADGAELYDGKPEPFIWGIAKNVKREDWTAMCRRRTESLDDHPEPKTTPFEQVEIGIELQEALACLSDADRALLLASSEADLATLCKALGKSNAALRVQLHRIRKRVREYLEDRMKQTARRRHEQERG